MKSGKTSGTCEKAFARPRCAQIPVNDLKNMPHFGGVSSRWRSPISKKPLEPHAQLHNVPRPTLPDYHHRPTVLPQKPHNSSVPSHIVFAFLHPERHASARSCRKLAPVAMPETSMNENYPPLAGNDDVRAPRKAFYVHTIPMPIILKKTLHYHFLLRSVSRNGLHDLAPRCSINNISHLTRCLPKTRGRASFTFRGKPSNTLLNDATHRAP
jgi:hypothetical protein